MHIPSPHWLRRLLVSEFAALLITCCTTASADGPADNNPDTVRPVPKVGIEVPEADRQELEAGLKKLGAMLDELRPKGLIKEPRRINVHGPEKLFDVWADVAIFHRAVRVALEDHEFFDPKEIDAAKKLLQIGLDRATQLKASDKRWIAPWENQKGLVVRGYLSQIDQTPQPYGLVIPESYDPKAKRAYRLDVWHHGRGETLSELNFITQRLNQVGPVSPPDTIVLHPYGRYCNANKFAGEIDTIEAVNAASQAYKIHMNRIASRGFSMGGAACWQFAVHYPHLWFAATPGAGFSETPEFLKFFQKETLDPPWWEEKLWRWYDCPGYVTNLKNLNVIAYSGENDIQKQAADIMEAAYEKAGMKLTHLIGPQMGHSIHPDAAKEIEAKLQEWDSVEKTLPIVGADYTTYSLIYPEFHGGRIFALKEHWEEARIQVEQLPTGGIDVKTTNISEFTLAGVNVGEAGKRAREQGVRIDGQLIQPGAYPEKFTDLFSFILDADGWKPIGFEQRMDRREVRKSSLTCGPIDHAFMSSFIFVKPTGKCAHPNVQKWVDAEMNRAIAQWRRQFRGDVRVVLDTDMTDDVFRLRNDEIQNANLILWGDTQSNLWIKKLADKLPIQWTDTEITVGEQKYDSANHALIAIYPNPLSGKYIVLNSGFTYREYDYLNNARQTPKLPDWAVVDLRTPPNSRWPGKIVAADFFDEEWKLKPAKK